MGTVQTILKGGKAMKTVWRLNIKTGAHEGVDPRKFCIDKNILGIGWPLDTIDVIPNWENYSRLAKELYKDDNGWWPAVNALKNRMQVDDLCWTRTMDGIYYLGRISGDWEYKSEPEYKNADIVNIRKCDWFPVGAVDAVPGKVINSFIPRRTVQEVQDPSTSLYSQYLYNKLSKKDFYKLKEISKEISLDIFSLISAEDCEDLVGLYLQELKGYRIIPSSCKISTAAYEFVLKQSNSGKKAVAQVKQGYINLNLNDYSAIKDCDIYLFTTKGEYIGSSNPKVHCIDPGEIRKFANERRSILSDRLIKWLELMDEIEQTLTNKESKN